MIVIAKFKGANGSKGYVTDKRYRLEFNTIWTRNMFARIEISNAEVNGWDKNTTVEYSSLRKFLDNWEVL